MLIAISALGVMGVIPDLEIRDDFIIVRGPPLISMSYGGWIVVPGDASESLILHEYGHYLQERKYGYLHELLVVLPSLLSAKISKDLGAHQARWFEIEATELGE